MRSFATAAVVVSLLASCTCGRGPGLSTRQGELVVVVPGSGEPTLETQGVVRAPAVAMGAQGRSTVTLRNIGQAPVVLLGLTSLGGSAALVLGEVPPTTLVPGEDLEVEVLFQPPQDADATLVSVEHRALWQADLEGDQGDRPATTVEVVADALAADCLVPAQFDFGLVPLGHRITVPLGLTNTSLAEATVTLGAVAGDDPAFFQVEGETSANLSPGLTATFSLAFQPTADRPYAATLEVRKAASCPVGLVRLTGTGSDESLFWTPPVVDFGRLPLGETAFKRLTFHNQAAAPVTLSTFTVQGAIFGVQAAGDVVVPARGTAEVELSCSPQVLGPAQGALTVELPFTPVRTARIVLTCAGGGPRIRLSPSPALGFGTVPYVSGRSTWTVARRLTVSNVGTSPVPGSTEMNLLLGQGGQLPYLAIMPLNGTTRPGEFTVQIPATYDTQTGLPAIVGQNSVDLDVRLTPQTRGTKEAELRIFSNDAVEPVAVVRLSAQAELPQPCVLDIAPPQLQFGDLPPGVTMQKLVVLTNTAPPPSECLISGLELAPGSDPAFSATPVTATTVAAGQRLVVPVSLTFAPTAAVGDSAQGYLRFSSSDPDAPVVALPMAGRVAECLVAVPSALDFGNVRTGCRSETKGVGLYNTCSVPVEVTALAPPAAPFALVQSPVTPVTLPPGAAPVTLQARFAPTALATASGSLVLDSVEGTAHRQLTVPLSGIGDQLGQQTEQLEVGTAEADILFTVDDSCSMADEQASLAANFQAFLANTSSSQLDYHLAVITTDNSAWGGQGIMERTATNPAVLTPTTPNVALLWADKVRVGSAGSGYEQPLATTLKALTPPLADNQNAGFLRAGASLAVVVVSDASDQSADPIAYFQSRLLDVKGAGRAWLFSFSVIGPFGEGTRTPCQYDGPVDQGRYTSLVTATGGIKADICTSDWAADLRRIGANALGARTLFPLAGTPDTTRPISVRIGSTAVSGWTYDPVGNAIRFTGFTLPPPGSTVTVTYAKPCY